MTTNKNNIRLNLSSFHLVKGFAMVAIILGHMHSTVAWKTEPVLTGIFWTMSVLRAALIPIFMIISGFGFKEKSPLKMLQKTFCELIIPYLLVALGYALIYPMVTYLQFGSWTDAFYETGRILLAFLLGIPKSGKIIFGIKTAWCSATWYFLALFCALNIFNLTQKIKNNIVQIFLVILCVTVGYQLIIRDFNYYCIPQGLMSVGYCYIGYQMKRNKLIERYCTKPWIYVILFPIALAQIKWGYFDLCYGIFNNGILDYIGSGCYGIFLIFVGVYLGQFQWKALDGFKQIGIYTYWIICIHSFELLCFPWNNLSQIHPSHQIIVFLFAIAAKILIIISGCFILKKITKYFYKRRFTRIGRKQLL